MESASQVDLPEGVTAPFHVFVNGVEQHPGSDFDQIGTTLVFRRELAPEGRLGFWRWLSLFLGVAGTYRKNDTVDIVYSDGGSRRVLTLEPRTPRTP
ncbi:MAG TPA: hypothetical protein VFJ78_05940 [Gaiellaceae bacterium]|nr:hypothetical protein [Gaiellaceae bacterium]